MSLENPKPNTEKITLDKFVESIKPDFTDSEDEALSSSLNEDEKKQLKTIFE